MNYQEIWQVLVRNTLRFVEYAEIQAQYINWAYVAIFIFMLLFIWMVVDSLIGTQLSPVFLFVVGIFFVLFYYFVNLMGSQL